MVLIGYLSRPQELEKTLKINSLKTVFSETTIPRA
jgi:hypothetical protein